MPPVNLAEQFVADLPETTLPQTRQRKSYSKHGSRVQRNNFDNSHLDFTHPRDKARLAKVSTMPICSIKSISVDVLEHFDIGVRFVNLVCAEHANISHC